jgi:hypothetical protein
VISSNLSLEAPRGGLFDVLLDINIFFRVLDFENADVLAPALAGFGGGNSTV